MSGGSSLWAPFVLLAQRIVRFLTQDRTWSCCLLTGSPALHMDREHVLPAENPWFASWLLPCEGTQAAGLGPVSGPLRPGGASASPRLGGPRVRVREPDPLTVALLRTDVANETCKAVPGLFSRAVVLPPVQLVSSDVPSSRAALGCKAPFGSLQLLLSAPVSSLVTAIRTFSLQVMT